MLLCAKKLFKKSCFYLISPLSEHKKSIVCSHWNTTDKMQQSLYTTSPLRTRSIILCTHRKARTWDDDMCSGGQGFDAGLQCLCMLGWCRHRQ